MQLANNQFLERIDSDDCDTDEQDVPRLPLWDYIRVSLNIIGIKREYLLDLFDITPATLCHWEKGERQISQDKIVVLANLFGVTIDQFIEREINDDYFYENLMKIQNIKNPKELSYSELHSLFMYLAEAETSIEHYALGYIPTNHEEWDPDPEGDRIYIDLTMLDYFCKSLELNVEYDLKNGEKLTISNISFDQVCSISDQLTDDWGENAPDHIRSHYSKKYDELLLLSENTEFLEYLIGYWKLDLNYYLMIWIDLKEKDAGFDKENKMAKILLSHDAQVLFENKPNKEKTCELLLKLIKEDAKRYIEKRKEDE